MKFVQIEELFCIRRIYEQNLRIFEKFQLQLARVFAFGSQET